MCLAAPARIVEVAPGRATVERDGERFVISLHLLDEPVTVGDHVAVQAQRHAIAVLSAAEAAEMRLIYQQILDSMGGNNGSAPAG